MAFDTTAADALLKELYGPAIVNELNETVPFLKLIQKDAGQIPFSGREWVVPIHTGRNSGLGAVAQGGTLPTAGSQKYTDYKVAYSSLYGSIKVTGQAIAQTQNDKGAFGRAITLEMNGLRDNFNTDLNFQFLGDGSGTRAKVSSWSSATATLATPVNYDVLNDSFVVDVWDSTGATKKATAVAVSSVTLDQTTWNVTAVTLASAPTGGAANDIIVRSGNLNAEISGLNAVIGNGTYGGINPSSYPVWVSPVLSNSGTLRAINESLFQQGVDVGKIAGGEAPRYWFTNPNVRRQFFLFKTAQNRNMNTKKYDGGFDSLEYDGKEIFEDRMSTSNVIFGMNPNYLYILETQAPHWIDNDGRILYRDPARTDSFLADMRYFVNLGCTRRNAQVKISDIQQ